jgi:glycosyltransferase involved in cell wall biosynthesis
MKIGIDARLWNETGVGRYTRNLIKYLQIADRKNDYTLFVLSRDFENVKCEISNIKCQIVIADIKWHTAKEQLAFPQIIYREKLDLMHFPYFSIPVLYRKPFVITIHDLIIHHFPTGKASTLPLPLYKMKHFGYKSIVEQAVKRASKVIVPLEATKQDLIHTLRVPEDKVAVTYEGVDGEVLSIGNSVSSIEKRVWSIKEMKSTQYSILNTRYFLYVGNAYPHKNLDTLVAGFLSLQDNPRMENTMLILVGKKDYFYDRLSIKLRQKKIKSVQIYHDVSDALLAQLYSGAIAVIAPSYMEGFGLVPLEAMANKCLVIASDIPAHREVCEDAAVFFDPTRPADLQFALLHTLELDELKKDKQIKAGLKRLENFSWQKMAEQTLNVYSNLLK